MNPRRAVGYDCPICRSSSLSRWFFSRSLTIKKLRKAKKQSSYLCAMLGLKKNDVFVALWVGTKVTFFDWVCCVASFLVC